MSALLPIIMGTATTLSGFSSEGSPSVARTEQLPIEFKSTALPSWTQRTSWTQRVGQPKPIQDEAVLGDAVAGTRAIVQSPTGISSPGIPPTEVLPIVLPTRGTQPTASPDEAQSGNQLNGFARAAATEPKELGSQLPLRTTTLRLRDVDEGARTTQSMGSVKQRTSRVSPMRSRYGRSFQGRTFRPPGAEEPIQTGNYVLHSH